MKMPDDALDQADQALDEALARLPHHAPPVKLASKLAASAPSAMQRQRARDTQRRWAVSLATSAALAAVLCIFVVRTNDAMAARDQVVADVVNDHVRLLEREHPFDIESGGIHQVKPWFPGKVDFATAVRFAGDDDFPLLGGAMSFVVDRRAAQLVFGRRLHKLTLLVFPSDNLTWPSTAEPTAAPALRGYTAVGWRQDGLAFALVSDVDVAELFELARRVRHGSP